MPLKIPNASSIRPKNTQNNHGAAHPPRRNLLLTPHNRFCTTRTGSGRSPCGCCAEARNRWLGGLMIPVPSGVLVWQATGHTDMRKVFPGAPGCKRTGNDHAALSFRTI